MCKPIKCPQCGYEFTPEPPPLNSGKWTPDEDKLLLHSYKDERKTLSEIAEDMSRSQDAVRNRLYILRGAGKPKGVTVSVQMSSKEYDDMRAARDKLKAASELAKQLRQSERQLAEIQAAVAALISADKNHRNKAPIIKELTELSEKYSF